MEKIRIKGISCEANIGVPVTERVHPQKLIIDVTIEADLSEAIEADDFSQTVDYLELVEKVKRTVHAKQFSLVEALAGKICSAILEDYRISGTHVKVRKFPSNLGGQIKHVAVSLKRKQRAT